MNNNATTNKITVKSRRKNQFPLNLHGPVGWSCKIYRLHFCRWVRRPPYNKYPGYDTKQSDAEAPVLKSSAIWSTPSLSLFSGSLSWLSPIYGSNKTV